MSDPLPFLEAIAADPADSSLISIFADRLEESGDDRHEVVRFLAASPFELNSPDPPRELVEYVASDCPKTWRFMGYWNRGQPAMRTVPCPCRDARGVAKFWFRGKEVMVRHDSSLAPVNVEVREVCVQIHMEPPWAFIPESRVVYWFGVCPECDNIFWAAETKCGRPESARQLRLFRLCRLFADDQSVQCWIDKKRPSGNVGALS